MCYFSNNYRAFLGVLEDIFVVKELKMVLNFKPGEKKWKWNDHHVTSVGQRKNPSPRQDSNLWPSKHRAG